MDGRTQYTKSAIREAFFSLLKERRIERVTVTDICKIAGINRATFYRYYENQYELLSAIQSEMLEEIKKVAYEQARNIDGVILQIYAMLFAKKDTWLLLLSDHADTRFIRKIYQFFDEYYKKTDASIESNLRYQFLLYGLSGLFDHWAKSGMQIPPEKMATYSIQFRHDLIKHHLIEDSSL